MQPALKKSKLKSNTKKLSFNVDEDDGSINSNEDSENSANDEKGLDESKSDEEKTISNLDQKLREKDFKGKSFRVRSRGISAEDEKEVVVPGA